MAQFGLTGEQVANDYEAGMQDMPELIYSELDATYKIPEEKKDGVMAVLRGTVDLSGLAKQFDEQLDQIKTKIDEQLSQEQKQKTELAKSEIEQAGNNARIEMDSATSRKNTEIELWDTHFTNTVSHKGADSSFSLSYPNSAGYLNEVGDHIRIDKVTGDVQMVHRSGTCIKIDIDGNVTINTKGTLKQIVEGDMALNINGNLDIGADNIYIHSKQVMQMNVDQKINIKSPLIDHTGNKTHTTGMMHIEKNVETDSKVLTKDRVECQAEVRAKSFNCF